MKVQYILCTGAFLVIVVCTVCFGESSIPASENNSLPLWQHLSCFDAATRDDATINLLLRKDAPVEQTEEAKQIESIWQEGNYEEAIQQLKAFEATGVPIMLGTQWKQPKPMGYSANLIEQALGQQAASLETNEPLNTTIQSDELLDSEAADSRIGGTRTGASQIAISGIYSGKHYAAVRWTTLTTPAWSLNISHDYGATWSEVYNWVAPSGQIIDIEMWDWYDLNVGFIFTGIQDCVFKQRFDSSDGSYLGYTVMFEDTPQAKTELSVDMDSYTSNYPCIVAMQDNGELMSNFTSIGTGITNASAGLDVSCEYYKRWLPLGNGEYYQGFEAEWAISYIGTDNQVYVLTEEGLSCFGVFTGSNSITTVYLENDTPSPHVYTLLPSKVICMYEKAYTYGQGICYQRSLDEGNTWQGDFLIQPNASESDFSLPEIATDFVDEPDFLPATYVRNQDGKVFLTVFYDWNTNKWTEAFPFGNDHSAYSGAKLFLGRLANMDYEVYGLGLGYIHRYWDGLFYRYVPYFDRAPGPGGYCHARGYVSYGDYYISSVTLGAIDNQTEKHDNNYGDYTNLSTQLERGFSDLLTVHIYEGHSDCQCKAWIDWNQDLDFDDAGEALLMNGSPGEGPYTATVTAPLTATLGTTRMRISSNSEVPVSCGLNSYGEVEDYAIEVVAYCDADGGCGQYISRVQLDDIDNITGCDGYSYYSTPVPDLYKGPKYPITITINNAYSGNNGSLWIDWNHDMDFFDTGERIPLSPYWGTGPYMATIVPPLDAEAGHTRMRVRLHREIDNPEPCDSEPFGEVEDYVLNVIESPYCDAVGSCDEYISRVQAGDIDNSSGCTLGYSDYRNLSTEMNIGAAEVPVAITVGNPVATDEGGVWIDWNKDLDFNDAGESIVLNGTPGTGPYTAMVTPPLNAVPGDRTMRVRVARGATPLKCGTQGPGEVEDYTVNVPDPAYCIGYGGCTEHIARVQIGDIDNSSGCDLGYADYTGLSTTVVPDKSYELTVTAGQSYPGDNCTVFIDWDRDLIFSGPEEEILLDGSPGIGPYTTTIIPRPEVTAGEVRMRVRLDFGDPNGPCDTREVGEVEDYTLIVKTDYCVDRGSCSGVDYPRIVRVQTGGIDNSSTCNAYSDYTGVSTEMGRGGYYPISITIDEADSDTVGGLWIDWNQDLDFDDPDEEIALGGSPGVGPYTATIIVPVQADLGSTRMRIHVTNEAQPRSCGYTPLGHGGEVEDYTVVVTECPRWDFDCNGCINLADLAVFVSHWLDSPCIDPDWCGNADLTMGGDVGLDDYRIISSHWQEGCF